MGNSAVSAEPKVESSLMKNLAFACFASLLLTSGCTFFQDDMGFFKEGPGLTLASARDLEAHVQYLASDRLEGRRAGTKGANDAARYLAEQMELAGLEPAGENGGWFQEFEIQMPPQPGACSLIVNQKEWRNVGTVQASASTLSMGRLVSVKYGLVLPSHGMNDYQDADVEGGIVLIRRYTMFGPKADPAMAALGNLRKKIRNAQEAGAVGVILGTHPDDVVLGGDAILDFTDVPGQMGIPVLTVSPELFLELENQCKEGQRQEAVVSATVLKSTAKTLNVLGKIPGKSEEILVVGAHYDHLGWGGEGSLAPGVHAIHHGADDNASGTAVVLELAEKRASSFVQPADTVLYALWGAEEEGLLGSQAWVNAPTVSLEKITANINMDMVGRLQRGGITVGSHGTADAFAPALVEANSFLTEVLSFEPTAEDLPGGGGSDHMSFHALNIPAIFFFSGLHSDYHKPSDEAEKLDYPRMAALVDKVALFVDVLMAAPADSFKYRKPQGKSSEDAREVRAAKVWFGSIPDYGASPPDGGMQIAGTSPGGPAEKAGLLKGDIIEKVGSIKVGDIYDFMDALADFQNGQTVDVLVLRAGISHTFPLTFFPRTTGD